MPANVRRKLGVGPGSSLEWDEQDGSIVVRRAGRFDSQDVHRALFGRRTPPQRSEADLKEGIRAYIRNRHAGAPRHESD